MFIITVVEMKMWWSAGGGLLDKYILPSSKGTHGYVCRWWVKAISYKEIDKLLILFKWLRQEFMYSINFYDSTLLIIW